MKEIKCYFYTPSNSYESEIGDIIIIPAVEGEIGVMKMHMDLISELQSGEVKILKNNNVIEKILINVPAIAYIKSDMVEIFCNKYKKIE